MSSSSDSKQKIQFWVRGSLGGRHKWGCLSVFMAYFTRPWTPIQWANIFARVLFETRLSPKSLETLIGFLAHLNPKLCHKTKQWSKILPLQKETWVE